MKTIAILQSNYIPWKGYFDIINRVDEFVIYDTVQYTKNDWRHRNRIKTPQGVQWLSIPVRRGSLSQRINETRVQDPRWAVKHWKTIAQNYGGSQCFDVFRSAFEPLYLDEAPTLELLSDVNLRFIEVVCGVLGITTPISVAGSTGTGERSERLIDLCQDRGASVYLSGPAARDYLDVPGFQRRGIEVEWMDYTGYPEYPQLHGDFTHEVSIIDLICNVGREGPAFMKSFNKEEEQ